MPSPPIQQLATAAPSSSPITTNAVQIILRSLRVFLTYRWKPRFTRIMVTRPITPNQMVLLLMRLSNSWVADFAFSTCLRLCRRLLCWCSSYSTSLSKWALSSLSGNVENSMSSSPVWILIDALKGLLSVFCRQKA